MKKKLTAFGNSLGLIIERPILELLNIDRDTELEVKTDGEGLTIRPVRSAHETSVQRTADKMMQVHRRTFQKLAK